MSITVSAPRGRPPTPITPDQDPEKVAARRQQWSDYYYSQTDLQAWARAAQQNSRRRARRLGVEHDLTAQKIASLVPADLICPILGIPMRVGSGHRVMQPNSATIDRKNPDGPYDLENTHIVSNLANRSKSHCSMAQLIQMGKWAENQK